MKKKLLCDVIKGTLFFILSYLTVLFLIRLPEVISNNAESSTLKRILILLFFIIMALVCLATALSKIKEFMNEKKAISSFNRCNDIQVSNTILSFPNSIGSFPALWIIGTVLLAISKITQFHLFFAYLYFFTLSLFPLAYSICTHSKIGSHSFSIFYGNFFNRRCIIMPWSEIDSFYLSSYETSYVANAGARVRIPYKTTIEKEAIKVKLKPDCLCVINQYDTENSFGFLSKNEIELNQDKNEILIKVPPFFGFNRFLGAIKQYSNVQRYFDREQMFLNLIYYLGDIVTYTFVVAAILLFYWLF